MNANARNLAAIVSDMEPKAEVSPGSLSDFVALATNEQRFQTTVLACFAVISLLLASLGIYSVVAYSVVGRTREIGIRMALGARGSEVFIQVCRQTIIPSVLGLLVGLFVSMGVRQLIAGYLSQIQPDDGPTYIAVTLVTLLVVVSACFIPARRATRLNPVECLRSE
jgi:ABC-type antimicrobial peptide transport system permease subunit